MDCRLASCMPLTNDGCVMTCQCAGSLSSEFKCAGNAHDIMDAYFGWSMIFFKVALRCRCLASDCIQIIWEACRALFIISCETTAWLECCGLTVVHHGVPKLALAFSHLSFRDEKKPFSVRACSCPMHSRLFEIHHVLKQSFSPLMPCVLTYGDS